MEKIMTKGSNWIKGIALLGMMVAMVGVFASAPASASAGMICTTNGLGKISLVAQDSVKGDNVSGATVAVYNTNGDLVIKGTTDANGTFATYSCTGTFKVKVFANGYKEYAEVVDVKDNATTYVKAGLQPATSPRVSSR